MKHDLNHRDGIPGPEARLRAMTREELAALGAEDDAYIIPVWFQGRIAFAIHGGDGSHLGMAEDRDEALGAILREGLVPRSLN